MGVDLCTLQGLMTQELLDHLDLHARLQQVGGNRVAKGMQRWMLTLQTAVTTVLNQPAQPKRKGLVTAPGSVLINKKAFG